MDGHTTAMTDERTATEMTAGLLLVALDAVSANDASQERDAERYTLRLRFALARVDELRERSDELGGVFEPARLEVARAILEAHCEHAMHFVGRALGKPWAKRPRIAPQQPLLIEDDAPGEPHRAQAA